MSDDDWDDDKPVFRTAVLRHRSEKGISMKDVAEEIGLGRSTLYRMIDPEDDSIPSALARRAARMFTSRSSGCILPEQ